MPMVHEHLAMHVERGQDSLMFPAAGGGHPDAGPPAHLAGLGRDAVKDLRSAHDCLPWASRCQASR